jgi:RNA polymerase sigma-70 factor (ECF subfamily)
MVKLRMFDLSDWELVARARADDMDAFAELVRRYQGPVMRFCQRMTGSAQDAEEIAQDSFVRVYRHLDHITPQAKFSTLLFGIARNLTLNALRDAKRHGRGNLEPLDIANPAPDETLRPDRAARLKEMESIVERGISMLSPEHREIIILREINGLDYDTIAEVLKCQKGTVKSRLARAREQLRESVRTIGGELI